MRFIITSEFGATEDRAHPHSGIDLAMPIDTPIRAFCDGTVQSVVDYGHQNIGRGVIVQTADGRSYIYGHMGHVDVHVGQQVHTGTTLGLSGDTGNSTGPHLHFGEQIAGKFVDPSAVIARVDANTGTDHGYTLLDFLTHPASIHDAIQAAALNLLQSLGDMLLHLGYSIALVLSGILIILKVLGFEHRWLKPSVLIGAFVIIRYLLG